MKFDFLVFSAHAPHSGSPVDNVQKFWQELTTQLMRWAPQLPYFVGGIDGNAHFDLPCAPHIGPHGLEPKANLAGGRLKVLLQKLGGFLPATFEHLHQGETHTWVSPANGSTARCDYIILPAEWMRGHLVSYAKVC